MSSALEAFLIVFVFAGLGLTTAGIAWLLWVRSWLKTGISYSKFSKTYWKTNPDGFWVDVILSSIGAVIMTAIGVYITVMYIYTVWATGVVPSNH